MKKLITLLLASAMLLSVVACGSQTPSGTDGTSGGPGEAQTTAPAGTTKPTGNPGNPPVDKTKLQAIKDFEPAGEKQITHFQNTYSVTYTGAGFEANVGIDYSKYDFTGSGSDLVYYCTNVMKDRDGWKNKKVKYEVLTDSGEYKSVSSASTISRSYDGVLAKIKIESNSVLVQIEKIDPRVSVQVSKVSASSGDYLMLEYYSNVQVLYQANVGTSTGTKNIDAGKYENDKFSACTLVTEDNGLSYYKGYAQVTVPYSTPGDNYNITVYTFNNNESRRKIIADIPLTITDNGKYGETEFHVVFGGDWSKVKSESYVEQLTDMFYNSYSRLYYRWNTAGKAAATVQFMADPFYDGAAYSMGHEVVVSTTFANNNPTAIGTHCHEITHQVQNYGMNYDDRAYFTENMANFGGHRYFHWANANGKYVQYYEPTDLGILNWTRTVQGKLSYEPYGDGSKWFLSFLDWMFPSTYNGKTDVLGFERIETRGFIDEINYRAQHGGINDYDPDLPTSAFSKVIQQVSNGEFQTYEDVRLFYVLQLITYAKDNGKISAEGLDDPNSEISKLVKDATIHKGLNDGKEFTTYTALYDHFKAQMKSYKERFGTEGWSFVGFEDYTDNFITENLPYTENPNYPMLGGIERGDKTADKLETPVTEGTNLFGGATVLRDSDVAGANKSGKLIDGKPNTQWSGRAATLGDATCQLSGISGYIVVDLGEAKTFNTYTLYHATTKNPNATNTTDWEILVSDDAKDWTSVDNQTGMGTDKIESYTFETVTARYVMLRIYPLASGLANFSFYEMMLFNV